MISTLPHVIETWKNTSNCAKESKIYTTTVRGPRTSKKKHRNLRKTSESAPWVRTSEKHALLILDKRRQHSAKGTKTRDASRRSKKVCHDPWNVGRDTDPATPVGKDIEPHCCRWRVELVVTRMVDALDGTMGRLLFGCWTYLSFSPFTMDRGMPAVTRSSHGCHTCNAF